MVSLSSFALNLPNGNFIIIWETWFEMMEITRR
nr:MAG TPA: hypothetical protein [Caudoviricetes sp.]